MTKPLVDNSDDILALIPQRPPMVMVDALVSVDEEENSSCSSLTVLPDNIFVRDGRFLEAGIIEHAAQSAALRIGYILRRRGMTVPAGFICSVNKVSFHGSPAVGCRITTEVRVLQEVGTLTAIGFATYVNDNLLAEGQMKIILDL